MYDILKIYCRKQLLNGHHKKKEFKIMFPQFWYLNNYKFKVDFKKQVDRLNYMKS